MDFWVAIKIVFRRWYVALPALLATIAMATWVFRAVPPAYEAEGRVLLLSPPRVTGQQTATLNPFADLNSSLSVAAGVVAQIMNYDSTRERLRDEGATADYAVVAGGQGPLLVVSATSDIPREAIDTAKVVAKGIQDELIRQQQAAGAPADTFIRALPLLSPDKADRLSGGRIRAAAAVGALGAAVSLSVIFLIESVARGRRERALARGQAQAGEVAPVAEDEAEVPTAAAPPAEEPPPPPPTEEPAPPTEEPAPPTEEPAPPTEEPAPPTEEPAPPTEEPAPPTEEPALRRWPDGRDKEMVPAAGRLKDVRKSSWRRKTTRQPTHD